MPILRCTREEKTSRLQQYIVMVPADYSEK